MLYPWQHLPESVRIPLLQCSTGRVHLLNTAATALEAINNASEVPISEAARNTLLHLGAGLIQTAFEENPLDTLSAQRLKELDKAIPFIHGRLRILINRVLAGNTPVQSTSFTRLERLARENDVAGLCAFVQENCTKYVGNTFWLNYAHYLALREGRYQWLADILTHAHNDIPEPLHSVALADIALLTNDAATAANLYAKAYNEVPCLLWRERQGEALMQAGHEDEALALWEGILTERPWHVNLWQRCYGYRHGLHRPGNLPAGPGAILLFTWNGGHKIDLTLEAIAASRLPEYVGNAQILVIDNGSTGDTPAILAAWAEKLSPRMHIITLPCNIGAPGARNWLLTRPEIQSVDWLVYLDDDLLVPPDWLGHFGTAMTAAPEHQVYGCQVLRYATPRIIQSVDMHQLPGTSTDMDNPAKNHTYLQVSSHGDGVPDMGQFAYTRPCLHVTGCCHLFRREALLAGGGFDLRFSPTQVDDFERDVRMAANGSMACYHGHLRVQHMQATGAACTQNSAKAMNSHANHLKLMSLYPPREAEALRLRCAQTLLQDIIRKQQ